MAAEPVAVDESLVHEHGGHGGDEPRVSAGPHLQVEVGHRRGLGDPRVDHDHRSAGIGGDRLERGAGVRDAVGDPRVLADEERDLAMLEVTAQRCAEHLAHDQHLAGLLLRDGVRPEPDAERLEGCRSVGAAEVVALSAAAVVHDRLATMCVPHGGQTVGDLPDGGVPVDLLEGAVGSSAKGAQQPLAATVLVVVEAKRLLAGVALRRGVRLVAAGTFERSAVCTESDLDAAVALAEDAGGGMPGVRALVGRGRIGGRGVGHVSVP